MLYTGSNFQVLWDYWAHTLYKGWSRITQIFAVECFSSDRGHFFPEVIFISDWRLQSAVTFNNWKTLNSWIAVISKKTKQKKHKKKKHKKTQKKTTKQTNKKNTTTTNKKKKQQQKKKKKKTTTKNKQQQQKKKQKKKTLTAYILQICSQKGGASNKRTSFCIKRARICRFIVMFFGA